MRGASNLPYDPVELYKRGLSISEVAHMVYLSPTAVYKRLLKADVQLRPRGYAGGGRRLSHSDMERTVELYRSGLSTTEVGELLGIRAHSVAYRLRQAGVPLRSRGESTSLRWQRRPKQRNLRKET